MNRITLFLCGNLILVAGCSRMPEPANPKKLTTSEIIAILENAPVQSISTTHSQHISITLKDGTSFFGLYCPDDVPAAYRSHPEKFDILNLSETIKSKRWRKWDTVCE